MDGTSTPYPDANIDRNKNPDNNKNCYPDRIPTA